MKNKLLVVGTILIVGVLSIVAFHDYQVRRDHNTRSKELLAKAAAAEDARKSEEMLSLQARNAQLYKDCLQGQKIYNLLTTAEKAANAKPACAQ